MTGISWHLATPWVWLQEQDETNAIGHAVVGEERAGFIGFFTGEGLLRKGPDWEWGWWIGHRLAYAQGLQASAGTMGCEEVDCPYVQFSAAWEAWCDGYNDHGSGAVFKQGE